MRETQEQMQAKQQLSEEELQRTQVLNLDDFKEVARIEKATSKKPAIFVAIFGFLSITLGTAFPLIQSLNARKEAENDSIVEARKETKLKAKPEKITCSKIGLNPGMGTDEMFEIIYTFENNELKSAKKIYTMVATTSGETKGETRVKWFTNNLPSYLAEISGYSTPVENIKSGVKAIIEINYELLDLTKVPAKNQSNFIYKVDYPKTATKSEIIEGETKKDFTCK